MSQDLAPPPSGPVKSKKQRRLVPWLSDQPEARSVQIGVAATVLVHLILLLFAPRWFAFNRAQSAPRSHAMRQFNIELAPNPPKPPMPAKPRMKYVEANPNAPENIPDKTDNVSDRNQQVAQEKPTPKGKSDMPSTQGRKDIQPVQIVDGNLSKPEINTPIPPPTPPKPAAATVQSRQQNPLVGSEKEEGKDIDGFAANLGKKTDNQSTVPEKVDGSKDGPLMTSFSAGAPQIDPKHPQERRPLEIHVRPAVFAQNTFGTSNVGMTALDSRWSNYAAYIKKMLETIQTQWEQIVEEGGIYQASGNTVAVTFVLNSKGEVTNIVSVQPSSGTTEAATRACASGVSLPSPYGPWTDDMISVLGTQQQMTIMFIYE